MAILVGQGSAGLVSAADPAPHQAPAATSTSPSRPSGSGRQAQTAPATPPSNSGPRLPGRGWEWWKDAEVKREIKLSDEKANRIESMFARLEKDRQPLLQQLQHEWTRLDKMTKERTADDMAYAVQVQQFEALAARWREMRTVLIYRMYKELQPEQYAKLREIQERMFGSGTNDARGRGPGPAPAQGSGR